MTALRKFFGPPYKLSDLVSIFLTLVVGLTIPLVVLGILEGRTTLVNAQAYSCQHTPEEIPLVSIISPVGGSHLSGKTIGIIIEATSPCVSSIQLYLDNILLKTLKTEPYIYSLDLSSISPGNHKVTVKSYSFTGKKFDTSITFYRGVKEIVLR